MTSSIGIWKLKGHEFGGPAVSDGKMYDSEGNPQHQNIKMRNFLAEDSIRSMAQGPDSIFYFVAHDNFFLFRPNGEFGGWGWPPFNFPKASPISKIWIDDSGNIFAGTRQDNFFIIEGGGNKFDPWKGMEFGPDKDSNYTVTKGGRTVKQIVIKPGIGVYSFAQDATDHAIIWIGTNGGLYTYNKQTKKSSAIEPVNKSDITITEIYTGEEGNVWFSTLERGMGVYNVEHDVVQFFGYKDNKAGLVTKSPVKTFCYKSPHQFFVAAMDSLPAIFNTETRTYSFINDSAFYGTPNQTIDIKVDRLGNIIVLKGGGFYYCDSPRDDLLKTSVKPDDALLKPFIRRIQLPNGIDITTLEYKPELLKKIILKYNNNSITVFYDVADLSEKGQIQFAWKMDDYTANWIEMPKFNMDEGQFAFLQDIPPGKYLFEVKVKVGDGDWRKQTGSMIVIVTPPFWQTWWFWTFSIVGLLSLIFLVVRIRVRAVRRQERIKAKHEKELLELEAKALRSQMNPHFIFNCLNSIKSLIQDDHKDKSVTYLTTFSKLIRTLFNNADKKEITLFDEIETCKLYLQLESMRFDAKFSYAVNVDESIDLKSIHVPALIVQPFIENAIWHGIMPKGVGHVSVTVENNDAIEIIIDDDGVGREASRQNKPAADIGHQSKGVNLTQSRLELDNLLQQRKAELEIIDKKDGNGNSRGTRVIIRIQQEV